MPTSDSTKRKDNKQVAQPFVLDTLVRSHAYAGISPNRNVVANQRGNTNKNTCSASRNTTPLSTTQITSLRPCALLAEGAAQCTAPPSLQSHTFLDRAVKPAGSQPSLSPR